MDNELEGLKQFKSPNKGKQFIYSFSARHALLSYSIIVNIKPDLKDLYEHVTPHYAADWKVIGTILRIPSGRLAIIESDHRHSAILTVVMPC